MAASASAGTYKANFCTSTAKNDLFFFQLPGPNGTTGFQFKNECGKPFGGIKLIANSETVRGGLKFGVDAAGNTTLKEIEFDRSFTPAENEWDALFHWSLRKANNTSLEFVQTVAPPNGHISFSVESPMLFGELECIRPLTADDCGAQNGIVVSEVDISNFVGTIEDKNPPTITTTPPAAGTTLTGTVEIPYEATDKGGGVEFARLLLDGGQTAVAADHDENGEQCKEPFNFVAPCKTLVQRSFSLDTSRIPNGTHTITPVAVDAAGNATPGQTFPITVHSGPTNKARPALSGTAKVGATLTAGPGEWEGAPTAFATQWLRCPSNVADNTEVGCDPIGGATGPDYAAHAADIGNRLVARVTASNALGVDSALSAPSDVVSAVGGGPEGPPNRAPQTTIKKHPRSKTALRTARFVFSSDQSGSSFQCKLDKGPFKPCVSPFKRKVRRGRHVFQVRAQSAADVLDPTPARFRWRVR